MPALRNVPKPPARAVRLGSRILKGAPAAGGVTLTNTFEGITPSGTTLTGGAGGNTGGTSGAFFDTIQISATATVVSDSTHAAHGGLAMQVATGGTAGGASAKWGAQLTGSTIPTVWFREYLYFTANPAAAVRVFTAEQGAGATAGSIWVDTTGKILARVTAGTTVLTSTLTIPLNTWFRVEGFITGDAAVGQIEFKLFTTAMDAVAPDETQTSAANLNTGAAVNRAGYGIGGTSIANAGPYWIDDAGASNTGYLGPAGGGAPAGTVVFAAPPPQRGPHRASLGARGALAAGILAAGIGPPAVPAPHQPPVIAHPAPHRALWRGGTGVATVTAQGTGAPQPFKPATVYSRKPHAAAWRSGKGAPPAPRPQPFRPVTVYTRGAHRAQWRAIAGPPPAVAQATGTPPPFRPATVYRRTPHGAIWKAAAGRPPAPAAQPFKPATVYRRAQHGAAWRAAAGRPPAAARQPRTPATVFARAAHRSLWRAGLGSPAAPPPPFTVGALTAATAPGATLTASAAPTGVMAASAATGVLTARTDAAGTDSYPDIYYSDIYPAAPAATLTATDQRTGGPG